MKRDWTAQTTYFEAVTPVMWALLMHYEGGICLEQDPTVVPFLENAWKGATDYLLTVPLAEIDEAKAAIWPELVGTGRTWPAPRFAINQRN